MSYTDQQKWKMDRSEQELSPALHRLKDTDYTAGYFFVTLNVRDNHQVLSTIHGRYNVSTQTVENLEIEYTDVGKYVEQCWQQIPQFYPDVQVIADVVMPDHFHGLLYITPGSNVHLGQIIKGFMIGCTHGYWDVLGLPWHEMKQTVEHGKCDPKWEEKDHRGSKRGPALFVRGYNDTIPIEKEDVETKIAYIRSNPERRIIKGNLRNQFAIVRNQHSANWTLDAITGGLKWDYNLRTNPDALDVALLNVQPKLLQQDSDRTTRLFLDYVGNQSLLLKSRKLPLICHRADVNLFDRQAEAVLREARLGAVIVSAFISEKERNILKRLLDEQLPVIEICDNGFGKRYKPYGKAFYACAEDRLLQITCWKYEYRKTYVCTRPECMVMNELARIISKTADDWWKQ
ncbi:MAG: hypothetical protein KBS40_05175 [Bacteroidales bacterium]|nr:hypothetical protein [Bacteroidales bacterium]